MIQLYAKGTYLDLISEEDISITIELQDINDITAKPGSYSDTFRLPSSRTNDNFFKYYFNVNSIDFDPTKKIDCDILHDGILFKRGILRLDEVIVNDAGVIITYQCFFVGEIGSFSAEVGDRNLDTLDLGTYSHIQNFINISKSWNYQLFSGDIVYGMIDWGYTYNNNCFRNCEPRIINSTNVQDKPITDPTYAYTVKQWRPSIKVIKIIDAIFAETSFTYKSNFLSGKTNLAPTKTFSDLYYPTVSNDSNIDLSEQTQSNRLFVKPALASTSFGNSEVIICNDNVLVDEGNNYTAICGIPDIKYTCPSQGQYKMDCKATGTAVLFPGACFIIVRIVKNINGTRVDLDSQQFFQNVPSGTPTISFSIDCVFEGYLNTGDEITMTIEGINLSSAAFTSGGTDLGTTYFRVSETPGSINEISEFLQNDYKKIDFLKDIFTLFNLVVIPDKDNPKQLLIEPFNDYIATGKVYDWTQKLDRSKDFILKPIIYDQTRTIIFKMNADTDVFNKRHQDQLKRNYGQYDFISTSDVISGSKQVETQISACPFGNQEDDPATNFAPMVELHQLENSVRTPIRPNPRILFYNGITASLVGQHYFQDDNNDSLTYSVYPRMLSVSELPTTDSSLHLQFTPDKQYGSSYSATAGVGFYQKYWENYIDSLYDSRAKQLQAFFVLSEEDVKSLEFSDVIFVKDSYWRVLKIEGIVPDKKVSARATLLKLFNYTPFTTTTTTTTTSTTTVILPFTTPSPTPSNSPTLTPTPTPTLTRTPTPSITTSTTTASPI
jgi:hypothetical protein